MSVDLKLYFTDPEAAEGTTPVAIMGQAAKALQGEPSTVFIKRDMASMGFNDPAADLERFSCVPEGGGQELWVTFHGRGELVRWSNDPAAGVTTRPTTDQ